MTLRKNKNWKTLLKVNNIYCKQRRVIQFRRQDIDR